MVVHATWDDVPHLSPAQKDEMWASYPEHEREARAKGVPMLGSGRVFPVAEADIKTDPIAIPRHWARINGIDFGIDHPFAAAGLAHDRDADCIYVTHALRIKGQTPPVHASAIKAWGDWVPCAWPHDGLIRDKGSGEQLAGLYRSEGLAMLEERATHEEGGHGVEAGIMDMLDRMRTGRLKVFSTLGEWFEEFRMYHRKDGLIVKERDDLMSATRYGVMMMRFARVKQSTPMRLAPRLGTGYR